MKLPSRTGGAGGGRSCGRRARSTRTRFVRRSGYRWLDPSIPRSCRCRPSCFGTFRRSIWHMPTRQARTTPSPCPSPGRARGPRRKRRNSASRSSPCVYTVAPVGRCRASDRGESTVAAERRSGGKPHGPVPTGCRQAATPPICRHRLPELHAVPDSPSRLRRQPPRGQGGGIMPRFNAAPALITLATDDAAPA